MGLFRRFPCSLLPPVFSYSIALWLFLLGLCWLLVSWVGISWHSGRSGISRCDSSILLRGYGV